MSAKRLVSAGGMTLLPAKPGTCPECATAHNPAFPHNQQSLYYQVRFHMQHGRYPTWRDAAAHCTLAVKRKWFRELLKSGQDIGPRRRGGAS